jgi:hypothetical protein
VASTVTTVTSAEKLGCWAQLRNAAPKSSERREIRAMPQKEKWFQVT